MGHGVVLWTGAFEEARLLGQRPVPAQPVVGAVAGGGLEPGARVGGRAVPLPLLGGDGEGLRGGLLREVEVAEEADQGGDDLAPLVAEGLFEQLTSP
jgi:hypothetical protein